LQIAEGEELQYLSQMHASILQELILAFDRPHGVLWERNKRQE
jgi:hypothetical protein